MRRQNIVVSFESFFFNFLAKTLGFENKSKISGMYMDFWIAFCIYVVVLNVSCIWHFIGCANFFLARTHIHPFDLKQNRQISFKMARAWADGTLLGLSRESNWILSNSNLIVIADRFPKAKFHYLVLPRQKIKSIFEVNNIWTNILCASNIYSILKYFVKWLITADEKSHWLVERDVHDGIKSYRYAKEKIDRFHDWLSCGFKYKSLAFECHFDWF